MLEKAIEILKILESKGYSAYIVGGFVRDYLLNRKTSDIDICTNATPKEVTEIFTTVSLSDVLYGAVKVYYKGYQFDVTTYRKEITYADNRHPVKIKYINDIKRDLLRRDFTINTLCLNSKNEIIDFLNIKKDLNKKLIKTVGNPRYKIKEDSLRILRAIRFATTLDFDIDNKTAHYIIKYGPLLTNLSLNRKKEELNKIFLSPNREKGKELLIKFKLTKYLQLDNLKNVTLGNDLIAIWSELNVDNIYPFTKLEKNQMKIIRELLSHDVLSDYDLYKYGLYYGTVYADIKRIDKKEINERYYNLPIFSKKDIIVTALDIANILNKEPGPFIKEIINDLEYQIITKNIPNNYEEISNYILNKYK